MFFEFCETCGGPIIPRYCLGCGILVDGHTQVDGKPICPKPGDISICLYCSQVTIFTVSGLRWPTDEEHDEIMANPQTSKGIAAVVEMRRRGTQ